MWYEIVPAGALIFTCLMIPEFVPAWMNYFAIGTPCRRALYSNVNVHYFLRDKRLTGDEHTFLTLDNLPDEDEVPSRSSSTFFNADSSQKTC